MADQLLDPAAVLQRVETIELGAPSSLATVLEEDVQWLCAQLRTALADTRRVDWLQKQICGYDDDLGTTIGDVLLEGSFIAEACVSLTVGEPKSPVIYSESSSLREAVDTAMAATPREE